MLVCKSFITFYKSIDKKFIFFRKDIDHLVGERTQFNAMIAKLQKKITINKKTISDLTELAIQVSYFQGGRVQ